MFIRLIVPSRRHPSPIGWLRVCGLQQWHFLLWGSILGIHSIPVLIILEHLLSLLLHLLISPYLALSDWAQLPPDAISFRLMGVHCFVGKSIVFFLFFLDLLLDLEDLGKFVFLPGTNIHFIDCS